MAKNCKRRQELLIIIVVLIWTAAKVGFARPVTFQEIAEEPTIYPEFQDVTIPPNIAPLNFIIKEAGAKYIVRFESLNSKPLQIKSRSGVITIPAEPWRRLLSKNKGQTLQIYVYTRQKNAGWNRYQAIKLHIAEENIDSHLVYRLIKPLYVYWDKMGIYERDLTTFRERALYLNRNTGDNCVNCHSFSAHHPDKMILHCRAGAVGTAMLLAINNQVYKIDTTTDFNRAVAYRAWHPNGKFIAFSANTVNQFFHATGENRDVYDKASDIVIYDIRNNMMTTSPSISGEGQMETYPEWTPDGSFLYYCSTPSLDNYSKTEHPYRNIKYDLMRIRCHIETGEWGEPEPVLISSQFGMSITHPKISPDGRFLVFCMSDYGNFSIYKPNSDLYLLDVESGEYHNAEILNSDKSESYHSWDSSGHWLVFSSKREDGLCARPYIAHFDDSGHFQKPFVMPQKDPEMYQRLLKTYNVPELVDGPVEISRSKLIRGAWQKKSIKATLDPRLGTKETDHTMDEMWKPISR
ncbi:MAG: hypothetical protein EHM72_13620 [Calditrichaeota bacterium]|nr:MAG: hypothetical protein EHM72_13620 [Calditrichota bacterium]